MINENKQKWVVLILGLCFIVMFQGSNFALMKGNDSNRAFAVTGVIGNQSISGESMLAVYLIEGAGAFLDSYTSTMTFLRQIEVGELRGYDFVGMRESINNAIKQMEASGDYYVNLKNTADITPYNPDVIAALEKFHYNSYRSVFELNKSIFKSVQDYLKLGDVRGAYGQMLTDTIVILDNLYRVKYALDADQLPKGQLVWNLNQNYAESLLFGQYMAGVFSETLKTL